MLPDLNTIKSIYIHKEPVDLRKGIDGYMSLVQTDLNLDPYDGSLYLFSNRKHNKVKGILYTGKGFWLLYFRPETGTFKWRISKDGTNALISGEQLDWLMNGFEMERISSFETCCPKYH